jgi:CRISPR-associated protein Cmr5
MSVPAPTLTRQQRYLTLALAHVEMVAREAKEAKDIYGGLCHTFPVLVRTCGLCQALAYVEAKAAGNGARGKAYTLLRGHVAAVLGVPDALAAARDAEVTEYMRYTRTILAAWIFYKRFAVSLLKVESGQAADDGAAQ